MFVQEDGKRAVYKSFVFSPSRPNSSSLVPLIPMNDECQFKGNFYRLHKEGYNHPCYYLLIEFAEQSDDSDDDFSPIAYALLQINNEDETLNYGDFELELYPQPVVNPPNKSPLKGRISLTITDYREIELPTTIRPPSVPHSVPKKVPPEIISDDSVVIDNKVEVIGVEVLPSDSFDVCLDSMRFIPPNCGLIKVTLSGLTIANKSVISSTNMIPNQPVVYPHISSTVSMPSYLEKRTIKVGTIDFTTILVGTLEVYDIIEKRFGVLGYFAVNLFVDRSTGEPITDSKTPALLNEGNFQLPILCELPMPQPLTIKEL